MPGFSQFSIPGSARALEIVRCRGGRVARNTAVNRRLRGLMRILFSTPVGDDAVVPWEAYGFPTMFLYSMVSALLAKAFGVGRLLRTAKGPYLDEKEVVLTH